MQFKVPQFLDIEDKIFGPFTFSEFVYLVGGGGLCYFLYKLLGLAIAFIPIIAVAALALALVFYKPNDKPFVDMIEHALNYFIQNKLYIWKRRVKKVERVKLNQETMQVELNQHISKLNKSKLRDLAWSLDVLDAKTDVQK